MSFHPDAVLADPAVSAAVEALAARNQHHLEGMSPQEQADAIGHWRELAVDVLTAARATLTDPEAPAPEPGDDAPGRAVIVLEDLGGEDVAVHAAFHPELEDLGGGEIAGTPAQVTALMLLGSLEGEGEGEDGHEGHDH
jgi:hypothetical protein